MGSESFDSNAVEKLQTRTLLNGQFKFRDGNTVVCILDNNWYILSGFYFAINCEINWGLSAGYQPRPQVVDRGTTARYGGQLRYI